MSPYLSHALVGIACAILGLCVGSPLSKYPWYRSQQWLSIAMIVVSIAALTGLFVGINEYRTATTCQSEYNKNYTTSLKVYRDAADSDRKAIRVMLSHILSPTDTPEQKLQAIQTWDRSLEAADKRRAENPVPETPACAQGTP